MADTDEFVTEKIIIQKGATPEEWAGSDWWTKEDWDKFDTYVEELKAKGEYLKEVEYTVTYRKGYLDAFLNKDENAGFTDFGLV